MFHPGWERPSERPSRGSLGCTCSMGLPGNSPDAPRDAAMQTEAQKADAAWPLSFFGLRLKEVEVTPCRPAQC